MAAVASHLASLGTEWQIPLEQVAYWCRSFQEDTKICYLNADEGPRADHVLRFLPSLASSSDIVIMNIVSISVSDADVVDCGSMLMSMQTDSAGVLS